MSELIVVMSTERQPALTAARPAWIEHRTSEGYLYYREAHNTAWVVVDAEGRFGGMPELQRQLIGLTSVGPARVALVRLRNGESVDTGLERARSLSPLGRGADLRVDTAIVLDHTEDERR